MTRHRAAKRERMFTRKGEKFMKHLFPKFDENGVWTTGPFSPPKPKRGPKVKGPKTRCHICGAWFCSRKQKAHHIQLSHRRRVEIFGKDGLPIT